MLPAVTFTPYAGLGDNYLQISLLLNWAQTLDTSLVVVVHSDGYVPPPEHRSMSAIHVQMELMHLLVRSPTVTFGCLPTHHPFPYDRQETLAFSPAVMHDRETVPRYWPLDRRLFQQCEFPSRPYVAIAFEVVSYPDIKAFTADELEVIVDCIREKGYEIVDIGNTRSLAEKAFVIDNAAAFVGAASGLAHIAAGLGKQCYVYVPGKDIPEFHWYTAALKFNGVFYQDGVRIPNGGVEFVLDLPPHVETERIPREPVEDLTRFND
jgi:hypothetical protein